MGGIATVGGRGRKPKPTKLRALNGNAGKRPLNNNEPKFSEIVDIEPPAWLPDLAVEMWQRVVPELLANKILTLVDIHNVEAFCLAYARWRDAESHVSENGVVINTPMGGMVKNPALTVVNEAKKQMIQFGSLLGLDPSSRSRLTGSVANDKPTNPFADL